MTSPVWNRRRLLQGAAVAAAGMTTSSLTGTAHAEQRGAADLALCILDGALLDERGRLAVDAHAISDIPVAMTLVDGSVVYDSSDKSARAAATAAQSASWARHPNPEHMCANC